MVVSNLDVHNTTDNDFNKWFVTTYSNAIDRSYKYIKNGYPNDANAVRNVIGRTKKEKHLGSYGDRVIELLSGFLGKKNNKGLFEIHPDTNTLNFYYGLVQKYLIQQQKINEGYKKQQECKQKSQCWICNNLYFSPDQWDNHDLKLRINLVTTKKDPNGSVNQYNTYNSQNNAYRSYKSWLFDCWERNGILIQSTKRNFVDYE